MLFWSASMLLFLDIECPQDQYMIYLTIRCAWMCLGMHPRASGCSSSADGWVVCCDVGPREKADRRVTAQSQTGSQCCSFLCSTSLIRCFVWPSLPPPSHPSLFPSLHPMLSHSFHFPLPSHSSFDQCVCEVNGCSVTVSETDDKRRSVGVRMETELYCVCVRERAREERMYTDEEQGHVSTTYPFSDH